MQIVGFVAPFWLIAEMGKLAILFTLGLVAATLWWFFRYARPRVERSGAIFHAFARLGALRHSGLDLELRAIVKEKGLRDEDPFDEVVARAAVLEVHEPSPWEELTRLAASVLERRSGVSAEVLEAGFGAEARAGFMPVAHGAALPHLRAAGLARPIMLLMRCHGGVQVATGPSDSLPAGLADVRAIFFLLSPEDEPGRHLRLLGHLATHVDDPAFLGRWLAARNEAELKETLLREDRWVTLRVGEAGTTTWPGRPIHALGLPAGTLVALIRRDGHGIVPDGSTVLLPGDRLTVLGDPPAIHALLRTNGRAEAPAPS